MLECRKGFSLRYFNSTSEGLLVSWSIKQNRGSCTIAVIKLKYLSNSLHGSLQFKMLPREFGQTGWAKQKALIGSKGKAALAQFYLQCSLVLDFLCIPVAEPNKPMKDSRMFGLAGVGWVCSIQPFCLQFLCVLWTSIVLSWMYSLGYSLEIGLQ